MQAKAGAFAYVRAHSRFTFIGRATPNRAGARSYHSNPSVEEIHYQDLWHVGRSDISGDLQGG